MKTDVLVIGSGPAGMQSAISAREEGAKVMIVERDKYLGGILNQCIHHGFGVHFFKENLTGNEFAERLKENLAGIDIKLNTMALAINDHKVLCSSPDGMEEIETKTVILAMGCREKTRDMLGIPGERPAGILTAGQAQRLINIEGYLPGKNVVILGSGDVGLIIARRLALENCNVKAVVELMAHPGGLLRNVVQCLDDYDIPLLLSHTITKINGRNRVESIEVCEVDSSMKPIENTEKTIPCDTLLLSVGMIPENELSYEWVEMSEKTLGPVVNQYFQTSTDWIFSCGNVLHVNDLVDNVALEAQIAGKSGALFALNKLDVDEKERRVSTGNGLLSVVPQKISGNSDTRFYLRVSRPMKNVRVRIKNSEIKFFKKFVRPAESVAINLAEKRLEQIEGNEIVFEIEESEMKQGEGSEKVEKVYVCTLCPVGCEIELFENGTMKGYQCKRGLDFVEQEKKDPTRILPTTIYVDNGEIGLVPIRSKGEIRKADIKEIMKITATTRVGAPVRIGQVVFSFKGVDFIATRSVETDTK